MEGDTVKNQNLQRRQRTLIFLMKDADDPVELIFGGDED